MFTQKLSMDCTKEQYEKYLKAELEKMGYGALLARWGDDVIVNNYSSENGLVGNPSRISNKFDNSRTYLGKFNAPLFLALAAMTDKAEGGYRELYVNSQGYLVSREHLLPCQIEILRKATVSEIMAKFGEQPHNGEITFDIKSDIKELSEQIEKLAMGIQVNQYLIDIEENVHKLFKTNEMKKHTDKLIDELQQQAKKMLEALDELKKEREEPKHKKPIVGEMAIMWDNNTTHAIGACFLKKDNNKFIDTAGAMWNNAILFESIEQYKKFINE